MSSLAFGDCTMIRELYSYRALREFVILLTDGTPAQLHCFWFVRPAPLECRITHLAVAPLMNRSGSIALAPTGRVSGADDERQLIHLDMSPAELMRGGSYHRATRALKAYPSYSTDELNGCRVMARNRKCGTVVDFFVDIRRWDLRFYELTIGRKDVLVEPGWTTTIDPSNHKIDLDLPAAAITAAPAYHPGAPVNGVYCDTLHRHYLAHQNLT